MIRAVSQERHVVAVVRWPVGGIRTYLLYNYPTLIEAGYRFTIVGPPDEGFDELRKDFKTGDGSVEFVEAPMVGRECRLRGTTRGLLLQNRFCLLHSHGFTAAVAAVGANLRLGVPHLVTLHDVIRANQFPGALGRAKRWFVGNVLRQADALIAPTEDARENCLRYLPHVARGPCRLLTIPHGIDTERFQDGTDSSGLPLRLEIGLAPQAALLGFFGRFMEQKGFLVLIEALDRLMAEKPPRQFHLVAFGSGDFKDHYMAEVERRPRLAACVTFYDAVANIAPLLRQMDLVVMPSLWEACGLLAMEAMAAEIPLIGSNCMGLREVLRGTPSRIVQAGSVGAWAAALRKAIAAPWKDEARAYGPAARERFNIAHSVRQLRAAFDEYAAPIVPAPVPGIRAPASREAIQKS